jgi:hypothetical protein
MNDPQIWTLIGVFAAAVLGGFTVVITSLARVIRAEVGGLRAELRGEIGGVHARLDSLEKRFDHLDHDVQSITAHLWRERDV